MKKSRLRVFRMAAVSSIILIVSVSCGSATNDSESIKTQSMPVVTSLVISGPTAIKENNQAALTAMAVFSDGSEKTVSDRATWSEDSEYATIDKGLLTVGEIPANQVITVSADYSEGGRSRSASVTVLAENQASIAYQMYGLDFSPYTGSQDPNMSSIISESQIRQRLAIIAPYTRWIRTFGSTHGLENTGRIAREFGLKTAIGAWLSDDMAVNEQEMLNLIQAAKDGYVDLAIVGSEALLRGDLTADQIIGYLDQFRAEVPSVPVATADVYSELIGNPAVIDACDIILANFYPYWEGKDINDAVASLHAAYEELAAEANGKEIVVSETGWPSDGDSIDNAIPSADNACFYLLNFVSWARAENIKYFYFEAFDEPWKSAYEGPKGSHWGIFNADGVLKSCMQKVFDGETIEDNWTCDSMPGGAGAPLLEFNYVPAMGSTENLQGRALHIWTADYRVAVYIRVGGGWWTKPYWSDPSTTIDCDGSLVCDITTGGSDVTASQIAAYLIPSMYHPPAASGGSLPTADLDANAVAYVIVTR